MVLLSREAILNADDATFADVEVPQWGGVVRVKGLTGAERDRFEASVLDQRGKNARVNHRNFRAKLVALCVLDENGKRLFSEKDIEALGTKSAAAIQLVFKQAMDLAGMSEKEVEELTEGFDDARSEDGTLDWPSPSGEPSTSS